MCQVKQRNTEAFEKKYLKNNLLQFKNSKLNVNAPHNYDYF